MQEKIREKLFKWASDLFPIYRSLTGDGNRKTLKYIKKEITASIIQVDIIKMKLISNIIIPTLAAIKAPIRP